MSTVTPNDIAEFLTAGDNDFAEDLNGWPGLSASGNVVRITVEPARETEWGAEADKDNAVHFEAHVFTVEPATPVAAEPVVLSADLAGELAGSYTGDTLDGWTVVANEWVENQRWESVHRLVIRNEAGEHFADTYSRGLTESQDTGPYEYAKTATFQPVQRRVSVVRSVTWASPVQGSQAKTGGAA